jgi:hypothetical protein
MRLKNGSKEPALILATFLKMIARQKDSGFDWKIKGF